MACFTRFEDFEVKRGTIKILGQDYSYLVMIKEFEPELPNFAFYLKDLQLAFVSEKTPAEFLQAHLCEAIMTALGHDEEKSFRAALQMLPNDMKLKEDYTAFSEIFKDQAGDFLRRYDPTQR